MMHANFARVVLVGLLILPPGIAHDCQSFQIELTGQQISSMRGELAEIYLEELSKREYLIEGQQTSSGLVVKPLIELSEDQLELLRKFYGALVPGDEDGARAKRQESGREACQGNPLSPIIFISVTGQVCQVFTWPISPEICTPTSPSSPCFPGGNECGCCTVSYLVPVGCIHPNGSVNIVLVDLPRCTCCE